MYDAIVIGSGPAGVFTAYQLRPLKILLLDVGIDAPDKLLPSENIYDLRSKGNDLFNSLIGEKFNSLENLKGSYLSPKLKAPQMRYVWNHPSQLPNDILVNFQPTLSYAQGGLANAWGAGVMRYNERELREFPISESELSPYYNILSNHIGITGEADDLTPYFGTSNYLQKPRSLGPICHSFKNKYDKIKHLLNKNGLYAGRLRSAVLSDPHRGRESYQSTMQDFFQTRDPAIYSPAYTLRELINQNEIEYLHSRHVTHFENGANGIKVFAKNIETMSQEVFESKRIFIGAGAINTARIVLRSFEDFESRLPLLDNPVAFIPFLDLSLVGKAFPKYTYPGAELVTIYDNDPNKPPLQASIYGLYGPLRTDLVAELPFSIRQNISGVKWLGSALGMLQVFFPDSPSKDNYLRLNKNYSLEIHHQNSSETKTKVKNDISNFIRMLIRMKYLTHSSLCSIPSAGSSIHYAGSLPMREKPSSPYETDKNGQLKDRKGVYIVDAANFPTLPSKNHTFTIMANAMRIAENSKNS